MKTALRPHRLCIIAIQFDLRLMFACATAICWTSFWLLMFNMGHVTGMSCLRIFRKPRLCRLCAGNPEAAHSQKQHRCTEASGSLGSVVCLNGTRQGTRCNISWCSTKTKSLKMFIWYWSYLIKFAYLALRSHTAFWRPLVSILRIARWSKQPCLTLGLEHVSASNTESPGGMVACHVLWSSISGIQYTQTHNENSVLANPALYHTEFATKFGRQMRQSLLRQDGRTRKKPRSAMNRNGCGRRNPLPSAT